MPLVTVKLIEGAFDESEKREMIEKITDTMIGIEGENMRGVTMVVVEEIKSGALGSGGYTPSASGVRAVEHGVVEHGVAA